MSQFPGSESPDRDTSRNILFVAALSLFVLVGADCAQAASRQPGLHSLNILAANAPSPRAGNETVGGPYLNWRRWVPVLILLLAWICTLSWVDRDAAGLRMPRKFWNAVVFLPGIIAFLLVFLISVFAVGYVLLVLCYAIPVGIYATHRNRQASADDRVFSAGHFRRLPWQIVAGLKELLTGGRSIPPWPPIVLLGKSVSGAPADEPPSPRTESSRGYRALKELIYEAIERDASDIHLEPSGDEYVVRLRIDGSLHRGDSFERRLGASVINIVKVLSALDITDRRRSQDGSFRADVEGRIVDLRVATQGIQDGEKLSIRILDSDRAFTTFASLGLRKGLYEKIRDAIQRQHGLFLVCGPTGSGKTTTLYVALREIDADRKNVLTVEDPIEYKMPGVNQIEVHTRGGQTFGGALKHLLRQDPDVIFIGEIRDAETAEIACQSAGTGHMVLSTIHANDSVGALFRLMELGVNQSMVANCVTGVLAQRLLRQLCPVCKQPYQPSTALLDEIGLPADRVSEFYRAADPPTEDCDTCAGTGYSGRIGVFEFLEITPAIRRMINAGATADAVQEAARDEGLLLMHDEGMRLVVRGVVSLEELRRVVGRPTA